ncbi:MAG: hypothetical protein HY943_17035 [Gammaproteobacteria bacterium]|nr:hypothetical protein [Gammaproteobacteria bacterium]
MLRWLEWHLTPARCRRAAYLLLLGDALLLPVACDAADLSWMPEADVKMRAYDNVRWSASNPEAAWGTEGGGGVDLKAASDTWSSELHPHANLRRFMIGKNLDADEYSVAFNNGLHLERLTSDVKFRYSHDSTLVSETTTAGLRNDITDRDTIDIHPTLRYLINDLTSAEVGFLYNDVTFANPGNAGLIDYSYMQASFTLTRVIDPVSSVFLQPYVSDFRTPQVGGGTRSYGGQVGYARRFSETLDANVAVGFVSSDIDFLTPTLTILPNPVPHFAVINVKDTAGSDGPIVGLTINKKFSNDTATFEYSRQVSPSARGSQSQADHIRLGLHHPFSPRFWVSVSGIYDMRNAEGNRLVADLNRDQAEMNASIGYRLTEQLTFETFYRYVWASIPVNSTTLDVNTLFVGIRYSGGPRPVLGGTW